MGHSIQDFLEIRTAAASGFSPDGSKVLVSSNLTGTMQLYRVPAKGGELVPITSFDEPVAGSYLPTVDEILLQIDEGGNERVQIWLVDDAGDNLRRLVHDPEHIHRAGGVSRDGRLLAYASNRRNGVDFDVSVRDLATGEERVVCAMGGLLTAAGFSPDGRFVGIHRLSERPGDNDVYLVDLASDDLIHVTPHDGESSFSGPSWLPDSSGFFFSTDHDSEFARIARYDLHARSWRPVLERSWDLSCAIDWPGRHLLVSTNEHGFHGLELFDPRTLQPRGSVRMPGRGIPAGARFSRDGRLLCFGFMSPVEPGDAWVYDIERGAATRLTESPAGVPRDEFVEPDVAWIDSFDGERIPALVFRPRAPLRTPCPVVVYLHGGPESQYVPAFNPVTQYLLHRGFAIVAPNVRGSTGYGKRFQHLDDVRKRLDSVRDLEAVHDWLAAHPWADHTRAALFGGSYGGYMVLAGLAFQPERWAAGVDVVGMSNLVTFLENTAPWRRTYREREYGSLDRDREFLLEVSPITHVDRMRAPLMIIHGTNDPRVPLGEAEQIHAALRTKGIPSELLVYRDEGHGLQKLKNRLDAYPKVARFLDGVLA